MKKTLHTHTHTHTQTQTMNTNIASLMDSFKSIPSFFILVKC